MKKQLDLFRGFTIFLIVICTMDTFGQNQKVDSLHKVLVSHTHDTTRIKILNELSWEYILSGKLDSAMSNGNKALQLAVDLSAHEDPNGLKSDIKSKARIGEAVAYFNIGNVYSDQGNYPKAMENYFQALKIHEEYKDKNGISNNLSCIGTVYTFQGNYQKALEYYLKALNENVEIGNKQKIAGNLGNLGIVYANQGNFLKALEYLFKALEASEELNVKRSISAIHGNIGLVFVTQGEYAKAMTHYFKALEINESSNNKDGIAINLGNIGDLFVKQGKLDEAEKYLLRAHTLTKEIGASELTRQVEESLSNLYFEKKDFKKAYIHYKNFSIAKDSIFNLKKHEDITRKEMNFEFEKKEAAAKAEQDKKDAIAAQERRSQKIITYSASGGLFLVLLLALFIFRGYRQKQKANIIITQQKEEVEKQKEIADVQKRIVEEKNKDITDSINYAKLIQEAILLPESEIKKEFSDAFLLFNPKDIVSGDFYWFAESKYNKLIAIADCTGHGVPGGFMSMLGFSMLQETLLLEEIKTTAEAFTSLDKKITETLNRNARSSRDGMDMVLCSFSKSSNKLQFSCANRPLILIRNGEVMRFSPDKHALGGSIDNVSKIFSNHEIETAKDDVIYLFSDGYADQFGGKKGKTFKYKQLEEILLANHHLPMHDQKNILEKTFDDWKGSLEQIDDVCVIGIRL